MDISSDSNSGVAFGSPGISPRWTSSQKDGIGTAYSSASCVWFTISHGILNEIYYPTIDRPQVRDMQFLFSDGETFFHEEKRDLENTVDCIERDTLGYRIESRDREGRYHIWKEIIGDPHQPCVLIHTRIEGNEEFLSRLKVYALLAPHLEVGGWGNFARKLRVSGQNILLSSKNRTYLALDANVGFTKSSCGFVGTSDGWQDLSHNFQLDWEFDRAEDGNVALIGEIDLSHCREFTIGLAFGDGQHAAVTTLMQSLGVPFDQHRRRFVEQWLSGPEIIGIQSARTKECVTARPS